MTRNTAIDSRTFWQMLSVRATGAAIVTAHDKNGPAGFLALSATHLTCEPPTMMLSIAKTTSALATIERARHFAINYLAADDAPLVEHFSGKTALKGRDRFAGNEWTTLETGAPIWPNGVGALDCQLEELIERHDAKIAIGRLLGGFQATERSPLISFAKTFEPLRQL